MLKARVYDLSLFFISLAIAFGASEILNINSYFIKALIIFWFFSVLYFRLRVFYKNGSKILNMALTMTYPWSCSLAQ